MGRRAVRLLIVLLCHVSLLGIGCAVDEEQRINITVKNTTGTTLIFRTRAGGFSRPIRLQPGQTWTGWVLRTTIREIEVTIEEKR